MGELPTQAVPLLYPVLAILGALAVFVGAIVRGFGWLSEELDKKQKGREGSVEFRTVIREESVAALRTPDARAILGEVTTLALVPHDLGGIRSKADEALRAAEAAHRRLDKHLGKANRDDPDPEVSDGGA